MTELLPGTGLQLNPDVSHPPFTWQVDLPADPSWSVLDTHPSSWQRSAERLVDERLAGTRIKAGQRREILRFLDDLVASCQQAGTILSLVQIGYLTSGELSTAGLHLAWYDSTPELASLATVRQAIARQGVIEEHETAAGAVLLQRDYQSLAPPGVGTRVGLTSLQAFLPLAGRPWTAVVATASAHPTMTGRLHEIVLGVAGSITPLDDAGASSGNEAAVAEPPPEDPAGPYRPVPADPAPGIGRGFGTMITHRIDPDRPSTEPQP